MQSMSLELHDTTSIKVRWSKPKIPNGPIDGYFVDVTMSGDEGKLHTFQKGPTDTTHDFEADNEYTV